MKKRIFSLALIFVLLLSGCNKENKKLPDMPTQAITEQVTEEVTKEPETEQNEPQREILGERYKNLDNKIDITPKLELEGYNLTNVRLYSDEEILVVNSHMTNDKMKLRMYNIYTGEVSKEYEMDFDSYAYYKLNIGTDGQVIIENIITEDIYVVNSAFDSHTVHSQSNDNQDEYVYYSKAMSNSGKYVYYLDEEQDKIFKYDTATKTSMPLNIQTENITFKYIIDITDDDKYLLMTANHRLEGAKFVILNLENMQMSTYSSKDYSMEVMGNAFIYYNYAKEKYVRRIIDPTIENAVKCIDLTIAPDTYYDDSIQYADKSSVIIVNKDYLENGYKYNWNYYDVDSGNLKYSFSSEDTDNYYCCYTKKSSDSRFVLCLEELSAVSEFEYDPMVRVFIWEIQKEAPIEDVEDREVIYDFLIDEIKRPKHDFDDPIYALYQRAYELSKKYSLNIYVGEDGVMEVDVYRSDMVLDYDTISEALDDMEKVLSKYPIKLLKNMDYGYTDAVDFYLAGDIHRKTLDTISDAAGYATVKDGRHIIVLDITLAYDLEATIVHELSHVIDKKIIDYATCIGKDFEQEWAQLNPQDFEYLNKYVDEYGNSAYLGNDQYTMSEYYLGGEDSNIYFIDSYSKTFPTEDRARVFEHIMTSEEYVPSYMKSPHIIAKAKLLEEWIKLTYDIETAGFLSDYIVRIENSIEQ
ncbi:MAG: hypothetical protein E7252_02520 [Lachnospira sp.]|nr:hypothetical protein [Lachnospira sp.]